MNHTRHLDLFNFPPGFTITLIGAGGIGAITAVTLAKMGLPILNIFDDDVVDETNLPGQFHKLSDIGQSKAYVLARSISDFADDTEISSYAMRVDEHTQLPTSNIVISAVDSINARKEIWRAVEHNSPASFYIDARMAAEKSDLFIVNLENDDDIINYDILLQSVNEEDVEELPCTAKSTFFCAAAIAGQIGAIVRNILRGEQKQSERIVYYIPQAIIHKFKI